MQKTILFSALTLLLLASCQKEGVYNPGKKISQVQQVYASEDNSSSYSTSELWEWNGKQLNSVSQYQESSLQQSFSYTYDSDRKLVKALLHSTAQNTSDIEYTFSYSDEQLTAIEATANGAVTHKYAITHQDKHISKIVITYNTIPDDELLSMLLPREAADMMRRDMHRSAKGSATRTIEFTWKSNNISQIDIADNSGTMHYEFAYDKKRNPYYNSTADGTVSLNTLTPPSRNNVLSMHATGYRDDTKTNEYSMHYSYQYNGKYPITALRSTGDGTCKTYYEYL